MNNDLKLKLETIISPRLLLENLPITPYGVAFVAWGVYNNIEQEASEETLRKVVEAFIKEHRFCIKIVDQMIRSAQLNDLQSFEIFSRELMEHPNCFEIVEQMFPEGKNI
jgi:hypothetical protein